MKTKVGQTYATIIEEVRSYGIEISKCYVTANLDNDSNEMIAMDSGPSILVCGELKDIKKYAGTMALVRKTNKKISDSRWHLWEIVEDE